MIKVYFTTRIIYPTANFHFVLSVKDGVIVPDMVTPLHMGQEVISKEQAKRVRDEFGKDSIGVLEFDNVFCEDYRMKVASVTTGNIITKFVRIEVL